MKVVVNNKKESARTSRLGKFPAVSRSLWKVKVENPEPLSWKTMGFVDVKETTSSEK